ncbi:hypothetical protein ILYODFUR_036586 [Ilyodon furcidens]|uniref:Sulfotransferase n=1 Tax=Ilyodon furcidens TaxID=33524 RepID=A0ABV0SUC1_9TELE
MTKCEKPFAIHCISNIKHVIDITVSSTQECFMLKKNVFCLSRVPKFLVLGLDLLNKMDPPRLIKTHLPFQLVPPGFWENKCKVKQDRLVKSRTLQSLLHLLLS